MFSAAPTTRAHPCARRYAEERRRKKVFGGGEVPTNLTLLEAPAVGSHGAVLQRYGLADGIPATGDMNAPDRGLGQSARHNTEPNHR